MIIDWASREARRIFEGEVSRAFPHNIQRVARRKLFMLHAAHALNDLQNPPGNRLERLRGDREGQHSIRINDQYRICFRWDNGNVREVEIVDYH